MAPSGPDASNSCLPPKSPVVVSVPPVPSTTRGERCMLDGKAGRLNSSLALLCYASGKMVVVRELQDQAILPNSNNLPVLVYRGHHYAVTGVKMSPSGAYVASGDERGMIRVWAFDHEEHLVKYDNPGLTGPIRDLDWDSESKRIVFGGERVDARAECARVIQWDTGVTVGQLSQHLKGRVAAVAFKPERPFRIVTAGKDDFKTCFHTGPPFAKIPSENGVPTETAHTKGGVHCVRYNSKGTMAVSVGTDRAICTYEGKDWKLLQRLDQAHTATIYSCAWTADDQHIMTASGDGTCKLFSVSDNGSLTEKHTWKPAENQLGVAFEKVPIGGNQVGCTFVQGKIPVSVGLNGQISILPMPGESTPIKVLTGHYAPVAAMAVDVLNQKFYTGDTDGILCSWDRATCTPTARIVPPNGNKDLMFVTHNGAIAAMTMLPKSQLLLTAGWDDKMYVTDKNGTVSSQGVLLGAQPSAMAAGTSLAVIVTVKGVLLVKENGTLATSMIELPYDAVCACISKDDQSIYLGGKDNKIHIYMVGGGGTSLKEKHVIDNGHLQPVQTLCLSNDGTKLASADIKDICIFDVKNNYTPIIARGRWCFHVQRITCLSWSSDDQYLASGGADDAIYLWSPQHKMKRLHYPYAHRGGLTGLHFVNETKFISVGNDAVVNLWDVAADMKAKFT